MTHFCVIIIVPKEIFCQGYDIIKKYIRSVMMKYCVFTRVDTYIVHTADQLLDKYNTFKQTNDDKECTNVEDFCKSYLNLKIDANGNAVSDENKIGFFDYYEIGGRFYPLIVKQRPDMYTTDTTTVFLDNNSIKINDLLKKYELDKDKWNFNTVVDKNGIVRTNKEIYWFGYFDETQLSEEWSSLYKRILSDNIDDYVVMLDCHM